MNGFAWRFYFKNMEQGIKTKLLKLLEEAERKTLAVTIKAMLNGYSDTEIERNISSCFSKLWDFVEQMK